MKIKNQIIYAGAGGLFIKHSMGDITCIGKTLGMIDFRIFAKEKSFRLGLSAPGRSIVRDSNDYRTDPQNEFEFNPFHFERLF